MKERAFQRILFVIPVCFLILSRPYGFDKNAFDIVTLKKIRQIEHITAKPDQEDFWFITSYCFDKEGNLLVADSGLNKIIVFDRDGNPIGSFGRQGQGPGEFMGRPRGARLEITYGNDERIYVTDLQSRRISIFNNKYDFQNSFAIPQGTNDAAIANRAGDIFILSSKNEGKLICRYDHDLLFKEAFLDASDHVKSKYFKNIDWGKKSADESQLRKVLATDDFLVVCSNVALKIFVFNNTNKLVKSFGIDNEVFLHDFKERVKKTRSEKLPPGAVASILPFDLHLDTSGNIYLGYWNTSIGANFELYRYSRAGELQKIYRFPEKTLGPFATDKLNRFYGVSRDRTAVLVFE